ncbi:MAG: hypothetical protein RLZZ519_1008 [Bacteroidota bacterium]|jgi:ribosomal-protein-alanine N-acetyltransferase
MIADVAIITTARLMLREATVEDAPFFYELLNSETWLAHIGNRGILTIDHAAKYIENSLGRHYAAHGFGLWLVALRENGQAIGICGILKRAGLDLPDLGFAFLPAFEGQGFAREAAVATLDFAENQLDIHEVLAITTEANLRSQRLLLATGFVHNGEVILPGETEALMLFGRKSLIFR